MKTIKDKDFLSFSDRDRVRFINSLSGFKSVNLIGTQNLEGKTNLSIISSAFHLGASPALMGFVIRPDSVPRDTLNNLRETKLCTMNHVNEEILERAHQTSARYPEDISEFEACQLTTQYIDEIQAPFVEESKIKFSLELVREQLIPENGTHLIITKIKSVHLLDGCFHEDGRVDIAKAGSISVAGLDTYYTSKEIGRLSYAKPDVDPRWI